MRPSYRHLPAVLSALAFLIAASGTPLAGNDLVRALHSGGYVILIRHASSPRTPPEAGHANPDNAQHERQLDETGRSSARAMGDAIRRLRIPIGQVLSSPTYRALETVRLAQLGSPKTYSELGDSGQSMMADKSGQRGAWLRARVGTQPPHGTNTIIVTHYPNILEAFPAEAEGLQDGEALVFEPNSQGGAKLVARVKIDEWSHLSAASS